MIRYFLILLTLLALSLSAVESPTRSPTVLAAGGAFVDSGQVLGNANTHAVALGDLNGDGHLDAFTANGNGPAPNRAWLDRGPAPWRRVQQWIIDIDLFYRVRDEVLKQTPRGQGYIELYYTHNQEILLLLAANADLRAAGVTALTTWQPNLQALVDGRGHTVSITTEQAQVVQEFLDSLESAASSELQQVLAEEREKLEPPAAFVGMTMAEVRGIIVGYTSYLPALTNR